MNKGEDSITMTREEYEHIQTNLKKFADYQRLSSVMIWLGIIMVILHILADIFFHIIAG